MNMPSAHDVARKAGVSQATVSRAYTPGSSISAAVKARVLAAAEELGYRPNLIARSLITGRSGLVGVVTGDPRNPFYVEAFSLLSQRLSEAGLQMLAFTSIREEPSDVLIQKLLRYRVDAVVLMSATLTSDLASRCHAEAIPVILFNRRPLSADDLISVTSTNAQGGAEIARHLLEAGYRRLAFMAGAPETSTSHDREAGFCAHLAHVGIAPPARAVGHFDRASAQQAMRALMQMPARPDAVFCANDVMAIAAIEVARHECGLTIGRDVGIVGFDDIPQACWPSFDLTTYSQPVGPMVDHVAALLTGVEKGSHQVEGALAIRSSTRRDG